ncbi:hypothetical protein S40293_09907 [Stachybotrys chartarum IBT 40293]|nr:hypothetical protein S40293_09907 [Stachybotrys chartarum IBT 40293]
MEPLSMAASVASIAIYTIDLVRWIKHMCSDEFIGSSRRLHNDLTSIEMQLSRVREGIQCLELSRGVTELSNIPNHAIDTLLDLASESKEALSKLQTGQDLKSHLSLEPMGGSINLLECRLQQHLPALALQSLQDVYFAAAAMHNQFPTTSFHNPAYVIAAYSKHHHPATGASESLSGILIHQLTSDITGPHREVWQRRLKNEVMGEVYHQSPENSVTTRVSAPASDQTLQEMFLEKLKYEKTADSLAQNGSYTTVGTAPTRGDACTPPAGKARTGSVASFFFSTLGPAAQMSTAGFLKSVLLQLLSANPGLIAAVSPSRWEVMSLFGEDPQPLEQTELKLLLLETLRQLGRDSCTLIIIDALDECQKHETFSDMLHLISEMPACREVKVCISSRPLANLGAVMSSFLLLDLDKSYPVVEMERYIAAEMDQRLASTLPPEAESRVRTCLAEKASGCFLWVDLANGILQETLHNTTAIAGIIKSVYNLPPGLDELLALLLQELHESHPFIAQALHLIACSENSNSLLRLYVMKMSLAGPGLPREISSSLLEDVDSQVMECAREILAKSKSLLVLDEPTEHSSPGKETDQVLDARLRLVHPRVKDVLDAESILRTPAGTIDEVLDSAALYCESSLAVLELYRMGYLAGLGMPTEVLRCASSVLFAWSWDETRIMRVLDELECASQQLLEPISYIEAHALSPWNITPPLNKAPQSSIGHRSESCNKK